MQSLTSKIDDKINTAQMTIDNTLASQEIMDMVARYGYTRERLEAGLALVKAASDAMERHTKMANLQTDTTARLKAGEKEAFAVYQDLAQTARAVFKGDKAHLKMLGLSGAQPKAGGEFVISAYVMFDNAEDPEVQPALSENGYDPKRLREDRKVIEAFDKLSQKQEAAKAEAQRSTREQEAAIRALFSWIMQYRKIAKRALRGDRELLEALGILARSVKTQAQRGAGKKAAATRAAKKK